MSRVEQFFDVDDATDYVFRNAWIPNFNSRPLGDSWFLSNQAGAWIVVTGAEFESLRSIAIAKALYAKLSAKHLVLTAANSAAYFETYSTWTTPHYRHPVHHLIVTTLRCNLACTYCHAAVVPANAGKQFDLDQETAQAILNFALKSTAQVQSFEFQGGESLLNKPVMHWLIPEIRRRYAEVGKQIYLSVQTNATLLNDQWMAFFRENDVRVGSSVDGPKEVHDLQRVDQKTGAGTFDDVTRRVTQYGIPVLPTITRHSAVHWRQIVDRQLQTQRSLVYFHSVYPINSAKKNWAEVGMANMEFLDLYAEVANYVHSHWTDTEFPLERRLHLALKKLVQGRDVDFADFGNPCGMIHSQIAYHTNGDVYTCDEGRDFEEFKLGNVKIDSYDHIVFGGKARHLKSLSMPNDPECATCAYRAYCSTCPVYDRAVTGELTARHYGTDKCRETMLIFDILLGWLGSDPVLLGKVADYQGISRVCVDD